MNRRHLLAWAAAGALTGTQAGATTLAQVRERGRLVVGLYEDMPPFHQKGKGIDVELGQALVGRKAGDKVSYTTPQGEQEVELLTVKFP